MIARIWHGRTVAEKAEQYYEYLNETGVADYREIEGNRGVYVLRRIEDGEAHFLIVSFWESKEAIMKFAGAEIEKARYYPEDEAYLLELEPTVAHYEVLNQLPTD
jgi:heme-degrading monooxygenase HmoA